MGINIATQQRMLYTAPATKQKQGWHIKPVAYELPGWRRKLKKTNKDNRMNPVEEKEISGKIIQMKFGSPCRLPNAVFCTHLSCCLSACYSIQSSSSDR